MTSHPRSGASLVARKVGYFVAVMVNVSDHPDR